MSKKKKEIIKRCPECGCEEFIVSAHVIQTWIVDKYGEFSEEISSCDEVSHYPDDGDIWECKKCHYEASGSEFNVEE